MGEIHAVNMDSAPIGEAPDHVPPELIYDLDVFSFEDAHFVKGHDPQQDLLTIYKDAPKIFYSRKNRGHWVMIGAEDMLAILQNPARYSNIDNLVPAPGPGEKRVRMVPFNMDPPDHTIYRKIIAPVFSPRAVESLEGDTRQLINELIDGIEGKTECDFVEAISRPMPTLIFMRMMGIPTERRFEFYSWVHGFFGSVELDDKNRYANEIVGYMSTLIEDRMKTPRNDMLSRIVQAQAGGKHLTFDELQSLTFMLFVAGLDTVTNAMTYCARAMALQPALYHELRESPELIPDAVEEFLRRFAFANGIRRVTEDHEYKGIKFLVGDEIYLFMNMSGLTDPVINDPLKIDFHRKLFNHLAFGGGPHRCAGSHLARVELRVFLQQWVKRMPEIHLKPGTEHHFRSNTVMGIDQLFIEWDAVAQRNAAE